MSDYMSLFCAAADPGDGRLVTLPVWMVKGLRDGDLVAVRKADVARFVLDFLRDEAGFLDDTNDYPPENTRGVYCGDSNRSVTVTDVLACIAKAEQSASGAGGDEAPTSD
jgi:hypothetical protein